MAIWYHRRSHGGSHLNSKNYQDLLTRLKSQIRTAPNVPGHEFCAIVEEIQERGENPRVFVAPRPSALSRMGLRPTNGDETKVGQALSPVQVCVRRSRLPIRCFNGAAWLMPGVGMVQDFWTRQTGIAHRIIRLGRDIRVMRLTFRGGRIPLDMYGKATYIVE
jgi:hypothetical protein